MSVGLSINDSSGNSLFDTTYSTFSFLGSGVATANASYVIVVPTYGIITNIKVSMVARLQIPDNQKALIGTYNVSISATSATITVTGHNVDVDVIILGN